MNAVPVVPPPRQQLARQDVSVPMPYAPSFIDRLTHSIQRMPIPYGITYFLFFILESAILLILSWIDGWLPAYDFDSIVLGFPLWLWGPLAILTYLDALSLRALSEFGPLLDVSNETKRRLEHEFTTMPARGVLINGLFWLVVFLLSWYLAFRPAAIGVYGFGFLAEMAFFAAGFVSFFAGSVIYYHSFRQLRLVSRTVGMVDQFDLFWLDPVYAFSVLTSRTGVGWVLLFTGSLLTVPLEIGKVPELALLISQIALAMGALFLPLRIVNRRLVSEKRGQMAELDQRVKATLARLHQYVDENSLQEVSMLNEALKGLTAEREILERIPTWPWRRGLFAGFISIIVLPVVLYLIQFALGRWLGP
ncbi:MAG: hypothetical protein GTO18_20215 [Anaerolineales bacterium]|nr:hypothetical protein [Anaerolineales bacterium]